MTLGEVMDLPSAEFSLWIAHDHSHVSPLMYCTARICHTMACLWSKNPPKFERFLPEFAQKFGKRRGEMTCDQIEAVANRF